MARDLLITKRCSVCGADKALDEFPRDRSRRDGHMCRCRACDNARSRRYYDQNADKVGARIRLSRPTSVRICLHCDQPATSSRHWFCDTCRAAGARRKRRPSPPQPRTSQPTATLHRSAPSVRCDADAATLERWIQDYLAWSQECKDLAA